MHRGRPMGESFDHRPAGWIRQSRKCCIETIHNHMVVDFLEMSNVNFAVPEPCLIHLTMKVRTATCAGARAAKVAALASGAGGMRIASGLPLEPVLDAPPAYRASDLCS